MSVIVDYVIVCRYEADSIRSLNRALAEADTERHQQFEKLDASGAGGTKLFRTDIYAAAFNHLLPSVVEEAICAAPWEYPDEVVVLVSSGDYEIRPHGLTVTELRIRTAPAEASS